MGAAEQLTHASDLHDDVVLAPTERGRDELTHPQAGLSLPQRRLLTLIDGKRSLREIAAAERTLRPERITRDAARLLGRGLAELEHGFLQPIARPTTVMPVVPPASRTVRRSARPMLVKAPPADEPIVVGQTRRPSRSGGTLWLALAVAGAAAMVIGYLMQGGAPETNPVASAALEPRPIVQAPVPSTQVAADTAPPAADQPVDVAVVVLERRGAPAAHAPAALSPGVVPPAVATPPAAARAVAASAPTRAAVPPAKPAAVVAPARPAAASAAPPPAIIPAPAAAASSDMSPVRAAPAEPAPPAQVEVPAWAREFAPVAPDSDSARVVAMSSGVTPIERIPPVYPRDAVRAGITRGSIRARAVIGANGRVERVEFPFVDASNRVFERPARAALMTWTFPAGERGRVYEAVLNFVAP